LDGNNSSEGVLGVAAPFLEGSSVGADSDHKAQSDYFDLEFGV
jgi:hypothetical protein